MPITELVFPVYNLAPESVASLKANEKDIFSRLAIAQGLQAGFYGSIIEDNGSAVDPSSMRRLLVLDWVDAAAFHNFYPKSEGFQQFIGAIKPFVTAPAVPELYEQHAERSIACTSSEVTQVIKASSGSGTEQGWKQLEEAIRQHSSSSATFYHANGIEKDKETFLGLIGWKNLQEYERVGKSSAILEQISKLDQSGNLVNITVLLDRVTG